MSLQRRLQIVDCNTESTAGETWVATALKVAFASSDMRRVDQHFGAASSFTIYALDSKRVCMLEVCEFEDTLMDGNEDKLAARIAALEGCIAVYAEAVGNSAIRQLKANGIQPVKVLHGAPISRQLTSLQEELKQGPGSWLARVIKEMTPADPARFDRMEAEGWDE